LAMTPKPFKATGSRKMLKILKDVPMMVWAGIFILGALTAYINGKVQRARADAVWELRLQQVSDSVAAVLAERDAEIAELDQTNDSLAEVRETVRVEIVKFRERQIETGENLEDHLTLNGDTVGLAMLREHQVVDVQKDFEHSAETLLLETMLVNVRRQFSLADDKFYASQRENAVLRGRIAALERDRSSGVSLMLTAAIAGGAFALGSIVK